ncbi:MAG: 16S rRNA (cytidine(1402)-2'-O)-methyltransferase [Aquificae bacterium]|nr:16S rRNA (cytidine(1402)-2'-O)-methyltransferase [Aquificota bacterium]
MGILYVVATPIGNLKDITLRALEVLKKVNVIACEDTRVTRKLLNHYGIEGKKLIPYHEHNEEKAAEKIIKILEEEDVALVSDAGTPCISDPGYRVVRKAWEKGFTVSPIPGPFAGAAALSASGLPSDKFIFIGFLPHKEKAKKETIERFKNLGITFIAYESPHRLLETLSFYKEICPNSQLVVAKELTKIHERFIRGTPQDVYQIFNENPDFLKGEFVILCYPEEEKNVFSEEEILKLAISLKEKGLKTKEIAKEISKKTGISKNQIYEILIKNF